MPRRARKYLKTCDVCEEEKPSRYRGGADMYLCSACMEKFRAAMNQRRAEGLMQRPQPRQRS